MKYFILREDQVTDDLRSELLKDGKYLFTGDTKVGPKQEKIKPMSLGTKRIRNRGNHFNSKNPNYKPQFQRTNEIRMLAKLKHNVLLSYYIKRTMSLINLKD